jgi:hypothetical protein
MDIQGRLCQAQAALNLASYARLHCGMQELQKHGSPNIVIALVGNKADLADKRALPKEVSRPSTVL